MPRRFSPPSPAPTGDPMAASIPGSVDATLAMLTGGDYVADRSLATALHLALSLQRPLFLEGEAGVGKTEIAKVLSDQLGRRLIRSEEHTSELQSLMRISYAVFCLKQQRTSKHRRHT